MISSAPIRVMPKELRPSNRQLKQIISCIFWLELLLLIKLSGEKRGEPDPSSNPRHIIGELYCCVAVAKAAVESGVARIAVEGDDYWEKYKSGLTARQDELKSICYRCKRGVSL